MTKKTHKKSQEQYNIKNSVYTSVPMNLNNDGDDIKKYKNRSSCSSTSLTFFQYLFSKKSVLSRLLASLLPPYGSFRHIATDYEGSVLNIILLILVLYNRVWKDAKVFVFLSPIFYVGSMGVVIHGVSVYLTKTKITLRELFCLMSYGLFGHTLALLISNLVPELFIPTLLILGALDSIRICCVLLLRTFKAPFRFVICTPVTIIHWLFLLYLELKTSL